jgi:poly(3-hydroxyalkanoate) synthetase
MAGALAKPDCASLLGVPVNLATVGTDAYVVAGIADHLCPWQSCYRSTQLLGGDVRFVLSTSGHIASMVNPPGNQKARFQAAPGPADGGRYENPADPRAWLAAAETTAGSWWTDYARWLAARSGGKRNRSEKVGGKDYLPLDPAPGRYVLDR